jgi:electron transport complex protein RnfB
MVQCRGTLKNTRKKFEYDGLTDCAAAAALAEGFKACRFSCLGTGQLHAGMPHRRDPGDRRPGRQLITPGAFTCGKCVSACPRRIIRLVPASAAAVIACSANAKGKTVREACEKWAVSGAASAKKRAIRRHPDSERPAGHRLRQMHGLHAVRGQVPPQLHYRAGKRSKVAFILEEKCKGCARCAAECKFDAIPSS